LELASDSVPAIKIEMFR